MIGRSGKVKYGFAYFTLRAESKIRIFKVTNCDLKAVLRGL